MLLLGSTIESKQVKTASNEKEMKQHQNLFTLHPSGKNSPPPPVASSSVSSRGLSRSDDTPPSHFQLLVPSAFNWPDVSAPC